MLLRSGWASRSGRKLTRRISRLVLLLVLLGQPLLPPAGLAQAQARDDVENRPVAPGSGAFTTQSVVRSFASRFTANTNGDIVFVANTVMSCPTSNANCASARNGIAGNVNDLNNNNYTMAYVDVDSDGSTFNSSSANLALPAGATILFAGLYWGGDSTNGSGGAPPPNAAQRNTVRLATPTSGGAYTTVTATTLDFVTGNGNDYQGFADVTSTVRAAGAGTYTVANIQTGTGVNQQGGWALVIAYGDPSQPTRNLTVFDGFAFVDNNTPRVSIPVSGFLTPPSGPVNSKIGVIAYEGDRGFNGDSLSLDSTVLTDTVHPADNFFTSVIANSGGAVTTRNPNHLNNFGYDASIVNLNGVLANGATGATLRLTTGGESYYPGVVTFVSDLFAPKFQVQKTLADVNGGQIQPADLLEYTIVLTNTGLDSASQVVIQDPIPTNTTYEPGTLQIGGVGRTDATGDDTAFFDSGNNRVTFNVGTGATSSSGGTLAVSASVTVKFRVRVNVGTPDGQTIVNTATAGGTALTLAQPVSGAVTTPSGPVSDKADLQVTKTDNAASAAPGGQVTYTITARNNGPSAANNATVADTFPAELTGVTWSCAPSAGASCGTLNGSGNINTTVSLPVNGTATFTATGTVSPSFTGQLKNSVGITPPAGVTDPNPANNQATDDDTIQPVADLSVTKVLNGTAVPGQPVSYTITARNNGPSSVTGARVTDSLPAQLSGATWTCTAAGGGACATPNGTGSIDALVNLPNGATATFNLTANLAATATGSLANTASIAAPAGTADPTAANNSATASQAVTPQADLSVTKVDNAATAQPGGQVTYTITATNAGPSAVSGASVTDPFPAQLLNVSWTCSASAGSACGVASGSGAINTTANLAVGGTATFTATGTLSGTASGNLANTASIAPPAGVTDPNPANNGATATSPVAQVPRIGAAKDVGAIVDNGDGTFTVPFTITVRNYGNSALSNVQVTEDLAAAFSGAVSVQLSGAPSATGGLVVNPAFDGKAVTSLLAAGQTLAVGASGTISLQTRVQPGAKLGPYSNQVTANGTSPNGTQTTDVSDDGTNPDPDNDAQPNEPGENDATLVVFAPSADLSITKTVDVGSPAIGGQVRYTLAVRNDGPSGATGVVVTDPLAPGIALVSATPGQGACAVQGTGFRCDLGALARGATTTITVVVNVQQTGTLANTATASAAEPDPDPTNNGATAGVVVQPRADLALTKADSPDPVNVGQQVTSTLTVTNNGPSPATGVVLRDTLPTGLTFVSISPSAGCTGAQTVQCPVGTLAPGASAVYTLVATANSSGTLTNLATVTGNEVDPTPDNNGASQSTNAQAQADIDVQKTGAPATLVVGGNVTYTVLVRNNGPSPASGVVLTDPVPPGAELVSATSTQGQCSGSGTVVCDVGTLASGATATATLVMRTTDAGVLVNGASATASEPDPTPGNNAAVAETTVTAQADLSLTKSASPLTLDVGGKTTFTLTVANAGPSPATNVVVSDTLPAGLTLVSTQPSQGSPCTGTTSITCALGTIASGGNATVTIVASGAAAGDQANSATVVGDEPDPNPANNAAGALVSVAPLADLGITKTASPDPVLVGQNVTYTIIVSNAGPSTATNVQALDLLPSNSNFSSVTPSQGTCTSGAQVSCALGTLAGGASATISLVATATAAGAMTNVASVSGSERDPSPGNNGVTQTATARSVADLEITKTGPDQVAVSGPIAYVLTARNNGPLAATNVVIVDTIPAGTAFVSSSPSAGGVCAGTTTVVCVFPTLTVNATATVTINVTAPATPGVVVNSATVSASEEDPDPSNNGASTGTTGGTTTTPLADLSISKLVPQPNVTVGDQVTFNLVVSNAGPSPATNVTIVDRLPVGLTLVSATPDPSSGICSGTTTVTCTFASLAVGDSAGVVLVATATLAGTQVNAASVSGAESDPNNDNNGATAGAQIRAAPTADLVLTKTPSAEIVPLGGAVSYTLLVRNDGSETATNVVVRDQIPAGLSFVGATPTGGGGGSCAFASGIVTCTFPSLASAGTLAVVVDTTATAAGTIANSATVGAAEQDPNNSNNGASAGITVTSSADLRISKTKTSPPDPLAVGQTVTYSLVVTNDGPAPATNVLVTDPLPANFRLTSATPTGGGTCTGTTVVRCSFASLSNGASVTITIVGTIVSGGTLVNVATVSATEQDPDAADNTSTAASNVPAQADVSLTKTASAATVTVGQNVTFTLTAQNAGPAPATNVTVTDALPPGATLVSATPSAGGTCSGSSTVSCVFPTIASGGSATVTLVVTATTAGTLANAAGVSAAETDPNPNNNGATAGVTVDGAADLAITKTTPAATRGLGEQITYTLTARNNGPSAATGVVVNDELPPGVTLVSATPTQGTCAGAPSVTCSLGTLANGASVTITIVARLDAVGTVVNTARIGGREPDPTNTNNGASVGATVVGVTPQSGADLSIAKTASPASVSLNDAVTFTLTVNNGGPGQATGVIVTDPLPSGLTLISATPSQGSCTPGQTVTCAIGTLAAGANATVTIQARATANGTLINTATVRGNEGDLNSGNNGATTGVTVGTIIASPADLVVTKTGPAQATLGDTIIFRITVANQGPGVATGVRVTDPLPAGLTLVAATPSQGTCVVGPPLSCTLNQILAGAQATVDVQALVTALGPLDNVATATADQSDPNASNNAGLARVQVAAVVVAPANTDNDQNRDKRKRETETEKHQREHSNASGLDDYRTEGNVVGVSCEDTRVDLLPEVPPEAVNAKAPFAIIATRDGFQTVRLRKEARNACTSIRLGDYLEADGEKQTEQLFDADDVELKRPGQ
ncbi:MAG: hypothetical protein U0821_22850 [Chloroflexota bacterium]